MQSVTLEEAAKRLPQLVQEAAAGEEIVLTEGSLPVAKLVPLPPPDRPRRQFGSGKGLILYMAPDFDAPLDDFKEYME